MATARTSGGYSGGTNPIYLAKGARVYVSGILSIAIPFYLKSLGYPDIFVGEAVSAILGGNLISNLIVIYWGARLGNRRLLQAFSLFMAASGLSLAFFDSPIAIIVACLAGNISTTGTEAGPFQSIEAGILPDLAGEMRTVDIFGRYNLVGYSAAAAGALTASVPGVLGGTPRDFQPFLVGFAAAGVLLFVLYTFGAAGRRSPPPVHRVVSVESRAKVLRLSGLFSVDAFGGALVSQSLLAFWFHLHFGLGLDTLGPVFAVAAIASAFSTIGAAAISRRLGNLRTMVATHLVSSAFLLAIVVPPSVVVSVGFLFLRQSFSQMDVPTRQALMTEMFQSNERVSAYAVTNIARSAGAFLGGPVATLLLGSGFPSGLILAGGGTKVAYDVAVYGSYRKQYK